MKKQLVWGIAAWAALAVGASAQSPSYQHDRSRGSGNEITLTGCLQPAAENPTGTTGSGSDTMGSSSSSSQSSRSSQKGSRTAQFILTNATAGSGSATGSASGETAGSMTSETAGTRGASGESSMNGGSSYRLTGDTRDLDRYVGQQVEIRGRLDGNRGGHGSQSGGSGSQSTAGGSTTGSTTGTPTGETTGTSSTGNPQTASGTVGSQGSGARGSGMEMPLVRVTSIRPLGTSCSRSQK